MSPFYSGIEFVNYVLFLQVIVRSLDLTRFDFRLKRNLIDLNTKNHFRVVNESVVLFSNNTSFIVIGSGLQCATL